MGVIELLLVISIIGFICTAVKTYEKYKGTRDYITCLAGTIIWGSATIVCIVACILP